MIGCGSVASQPESMEQNRSKLTDNGDIDANPLSRREIFEIVEPRCFVLIFCSLHRNFANGSGFACVSVLFQGYILLNEITSCNTDLCHENIST